MNASEANRSKWNARYAYAKGQQLPSPAALTEFAKPHLPAGGLAVDIACGRGANSIWLAEQGFKVHAWDHSETVVAQLREDVADRVVGPAIKAEVRDVVATPPNRDSVDVVLVCRFLERSLCPALIDALRPGGVLLYQTFTRGLSNPDFLLQPNELLSLFRSLQIVSYIEPVNQSDTCEAMLVARKPEPE